MLHLIMSYPELLKQKFTKTGVQGALPPCRGVGTPHTPFFLLLHAAAGGVRGEKEGCGDTPHPGKGLAALCNPASQAA